MFGLGLKAEILAASDSAVRVRTALSQPAAPKLDKIQITHAGQF